MKLNTYDGKLFCGKDTGGVGIEYSNCSKPWDENYSGEITHTGIVPPVVVDQQITLR